MVSSRSWRSIINTGNSILSEEELQGAYLRLATRAATMSNDHHHHQQHNGGATGAPSMLLANNGIDQHNDHPMNMGMQQHTNRFILQPQQPQQVYNQQGSSATTTSRRGYSNQQQQQPSHHNPIGAMMVAAQQQQFQQHQQQQQQQTGPGGRRMAPAPTPTHKPGMKDVPYWLKTLRLHKYTAMFSDMEYAQMMAMDEHELELRGVTKGARRKILQSIGKLRQRAANVRRLEATFDIVETACLRCAIVELRQLVATPILQYSPVDGRRETEEQIDGVCAIDTIPDENLPALMVRLLMRVYAMGVAGDAPHEQVKAELLLMYFTICDRMLMNEAFTSSQKRRIVQWRRAARRFAAPADLRRLVLPHPPPPRCDACTPVSTFYFNDTLEEIMRVQNLQRLVKQYLNSDGAAPLLPVQQPSAQQQLAALYEQQQAAHAAALQAATAAAARTQLQRDAALCGFNAAAAYAARPSALARKMMPRGGPVSSPPAAFFAAAQQPQHRYGSSTAAAAAAAYQQQQAALRMATAKAAAAKPAAPWSLENMYAPDDVFELTRPLDLDFTSVPSRSIWSNTPASSTSSSTEAGSEPALSSAFSSGYSSGSSERGSGAGSPRVAADAAVGAVVPPRSPDSAAASAAMLAPAMVFDFSRNEQCSSLDAACRQIQEQLNFNL